MFFLNAPVSLTSKRDFENRMRVLLESKSSSKISSAPAGRSVCRTGYPEIFSAPAGRSVCSVGSPKSLPPQRGVLFVERAISESLPPHRGVVFVVHSTLNGPCGFFRIDRYRQNAPLRRKKFCLMIYSLITLSFYFQNLSSK